MQSYKNESNILNRKCYTVEGFGSEGALMKLRFWFPVKTNSFSFESHKGSNWSSERYDWRTLNPHSVH